MDLWMVAAATGAGYIAKHWQQNLQSRVNNDDSDSQERARHGQHQFMKVFQQIREQTDPLRRLSNKRASKLDYLLGKNFQELIHYLPDDGSRQPGDAAAGGFDDYANVISLGRLEQQQSAVTDESAELGDGYYARLNGKYRDYKMISNLHSLQQLDPQIPSENFFAYQFYNRHAGIDRDDGHLSPRESALGPLSITDVTRVLSRPSSDIEMEMKSQEELSWIIRPNLPLRPAKNAAKKGPSDGELFFLGLTIGMMTSIVTSSNQVDSLNEKLKQAKNLVKDLQEELEMKDMLTVKEIEETPKEESSSSCCDQEEARPEDTEKSEAMSKIEAELEAELERLELNMKTTASDNIFEFDEISTIHGMISLIFFFVEPVSTVSMFQLGCLCLNCKAYQVLVRGVMAVSGIDPKRIADLRIHETLDDLRTDLAEYIAELSEVTVKERGIFSLALSGGCIIHLMGHMHSINGNLSSEEAANEFEFVIRQLVKTRVIGASEVSDCPKFDLILLEFDEKDEWVTFITDSPEPPPERITFTVSVINSACNVVLVATGEDKSEVMQLIVNDDLEPGMNSSLPAKVVQPGSVNVVWFLDKAAASKLQRPPTSEYYSSCT
ncbi:hypothetical protein SAY87_013170 [Trapa incisa]|uniref:Glucosamine/galactosamine-6-phosphate isomerase domain-containing protein n=1 Tax=Trapa incisa TaxID=236973 RepID=A0AAN7KHP8_9MYRT|nr:hypothetical protein SAY87_013170 [Trapa incisa]